MQQDTKKKLWFKAKNYGWGWYPSSKEGWIVLVIFLASMVITMLLTTPQSYLYYVLVFLQVLLLIAVCYKTGEKPEWRWGKPKSKPKSNNKVA